MSYFVLQLRAYLGKTWKDGPKKGSKKWPKTGHFTLPTLGQILDPPNFVSPHFVNLGVLKMGHFGTPFLTIFGHFDGMHILA